MRTEMLTIQEGEILIREGRAAIEAHLSGRNFPPPSRLSVGLKEQRGVFVSLLAHSNQDGLRGCVGIPYATRPLIEQVRIAAVEAATSDPRFEPLDLDELKERITLEATVLTTMEPIWVKNPLDLIENIRVGRDGLMVEGMGNHGLLLPQVALDEGFDSEEFLCQCCMKAGLPPDSWLTGRVNVSRFQGQIFTEESPNGRVFERHIAK